MLRYRRALALLLAAAAGCARTDAPPTDTSHAAQASQAPTTARTDTSSAPATARDTAWVVTPTGVGPVRIGMPAREALAALGLPAERAAAREPCRYLDVRPLRRGVAFMVERDTVVRVEARGSTLATAAGARVGDTEERVRTLYGDRATVSPHKYTGPTGHYLTVVEGADSSHQMIFETDGQRVTTYRAGRMPEVAYVESCS